MDPSHGHPSPSPQHPMDEEPINPPNFPSNNFYAHQPYPSIIDHHEGQAMDEEEDPELIYFKLFFSPKDTAESIQRRNQNLEMLSFENSDEEPDDVYNRRKKRVNDLISKQGQQLQVIKDIQRENFGKYKAIIKFVKFFCELKETLVGVRTDYYSNKTFCALKNASQQELFRATITLRTMYENVVKTPRRPQAIGADERTLQFLILPRFLISKQKINRLVRDQELQKNFQFLINNQCLGHYNNEANKKMPEPKQMNLIRQLLKQKQGRQKFKKICSINHGNKFLKSYGNDYYHLYSKSLSYLRQLDNFIKKGKKYENIKKDLQKLKTQETNHNSSFTSGSSSCYSFSFDKFKPIQPAERQIQASFEEEQLRDKLSIKDFSPICSKNQQQTTMRKSKMKKLMSTPIQGILFKRQKQIQCLEGYEEPQNHDPSQTQEGMTNQRKFKVKKHFSERVYTENIILVPPPKPSTDS